MAFTAYSAKIIKLNQKINRAMKNTVKIYRDAVSFCTEVVYENWKSIEPLESKERCNYVEKLIHNTKHNVAKYPFDVKFYKMPAYFRRAVISESIGAVSSYITRLEAYEDERYQAISNGKKFKKRPPVLNLHPNTFPTFYKNNAFIDNNDGTVDIKLFMNNDWKYVTIHLRNQDLKYIQKQPPSTKKNPTITYTYGCFRVVFPFSMKAKPLKHHVVKNQIALSVDLGINYDAVCSLVKGNGTILGRFFINHKSDKTNMYRLLNRLKKLQDMSGTNAEQKKIWTKINGYQKNITNKTVCEIIKIAVANNVDVIVMENLSNMRVKGEISQKISLWNKKRIIKKIQQKAHMNGIRYAMINPKNTSALAFDGSGFVKRDNDNYSLCTFNTGKRYHSDLNASYNIAARYFIREYKKSISEMKWLDLQAKVPALSKRTTCTFATMRQLIANM